MKRRLIILSLILSTTSYAVGAAGEIIFKDTLYGMGIGATFGLAYYLVDSTDFAKKLGIGLLAGGGMGLVYGILVDAKPFIAYQKSWKGKSIKLYTYLHYPSPNINLKFTWK